MNNIIDNLNNTSCITHDILNNIKIDEIITSVNKHDENINKTQINIITNLKNDVANIKNELLNVKNKQTLNNDNMAFIILAIIGIFPLILIIIGNIFIEYCNLYLQK